MAKKSYAESISQTKVMVDGMTGNLSNLPQNLDEAFVKKLSEINVKAVALNSEQEKLKADLKTKTSELETLLVDMGKQYDFAKKRIKLDFPQEQWKEFGIADKR